MMGQIGKSWSERDEPSITTVEYGHPRSTGDKWHPALRAALIGGSAASLWALLFLIVR